MREDADFMVYVGARWPSLLRTLVLLGCPQDQAPAVAVSALARCRGGWSRTSRSEDVDVVVHGELLDAWDRHRRTRWWESATGDPVLDPELSAELDALTPDRRADLVMARHAGLESGSGLPAEPSADRLRRAAESVLVLAPPTYEQIQAQGRSEDSRRARTVVSVLVPLVLVVAGITWWTTRTVDDGDELGPVAVQRIENPADVAWYALGRLHLQHVVLDLPGLRDVSVVGSGAVYGDTDGRVVYVADDGARTLLGHKDPDDPVVASDRNGWAAWVETAGPPRLVLYEAATGNRVGATELQVDDTVPGPAAIAVDGNAVYYRDADGTRAWFPTGPVTSSVPAGLLDVRSRSRAFQVDPMTIQVVQSSFDVELGLPGRGAHLSPDGNAVVTRLGAADDPYGPVAVYDTFSGEALPTGLTGADLVLDAAPGPDHDVTYIIARTADRPTSGQFIRSSASGQLELRTCDLRSGSCESLERFPSTGSDTLLAR